MLSKVYLEAGSRSQELLTAKWTLRSWGCAISSNWHEQPAQTARTHWGFQEFEEIKDCEALVVIRGHEKEFPVEVAFVVGWALARNLKVIWLGTPTELPAPFRKVRCVATLDEVRDELASSTANMLAA